MSKGANACIPSMGFYQDLAEKNITIKRSKTSP